MTQPFDNRDWDVRQIAELRAENERLKDKIRGLEKLNQMTDEEVVMELRAQIERLKDERTEWQATILSFRSLLTRAADALDNPRAGSEAMDDDFDLIDELRKAAQ